MGPTLHRHTRLTVETRPTWLMTCSVVTAATTVNHHSCLKGRYFRFPIPPGIYIYAWQAGSKHQLTSFKASGARNTSSPNFHGNNQVTHFFEKNPLYYTFGVISHASFTSGRVRLTVILAILEYVGNYAPIADLFRTLQMLQTHHNSPFRQLISPNYYGYGRTSGVIILKPLGITALS